MKQLFKNMTIIFLGASVALSCFALFIVYGLGNGYHRTYDSVILRKYNYLEKIDEPKIILIGGSNLAFGIDSDRMEKELGMPVVNLGLHAGMGQYFNTEISKANINEGDIVILAYEYLWFGNDKFKSIGTDLVMRGVDNKTEIYKYVPRGHLKDFIAYFEEYAIKKIESAYVTRAYDSVYSSDAFNDHGNMVYDRESPIITESGIFTVDLSDMEISKYSLNYMLNYKEFVESKGANIFFTVPAIYEDAIRDEQFHILEKYGQVIKDATGIDLISDPYEYLFSMDELYDTVYHLNNKGSHRRTSQLIKDISLLLKE